MIEILIIVAVAGIVLGLVASPYVFNGIGTWRSRALVASRNKALPAAGGEGALETDARKVLTTL